MFAGAYVDLYARTGARRRLMDVCRTRLRDADGVHPPVAFLTCNFAPPTGSTPSLLTHDDVITLFHEFGHGLHHLLTEVDFAGVSGISGVEWDAVELPSQFMENFAWERAGLDLVARHWQTGERLPDALFERMQAARNFQSGLFLVRLEFALFDFRLHHEYDPARGARARPARRGAPRSRGDRAAGMAPLPARFTTSSPAATAPAITPPVGRGASADAFDRFERKACSMPRSAGAGGARSSPSAARVPRWNLHRVPRQRARRKRWCAATARRRACGRKPKRKMETRSTRSTRRRAFQGNLENPPRSVIPAEAGVTRR